MILSCIIEMEFSYLFLFICNLSIALSVIFVYSDLNVQLKSASEIEKIIYQSNICNPSKGLNDNAVYQVIKNSIIIKKNINWFLFVTSITPLIFILIK